MFCLWIGVILDEMFALTLCNCQHTVVLLGLGELRVVPQGQFVSEETDR